MTNRLSRLSRSVEGRVALITGAANGMGRATAFVFADAGARLILTDLDGEALEDVAKQITAAGGEALTQALDVSDRAAITQAIEAGATAFGGLDIVINNAGIAAGLPIDHPDFDATWERTLDVNLNAHVSVIRAALPWLRKSDSGRIINIASTEGLGATRNISPYTASKHGVVGLTRSLAQELGAEGITVNAICPGPIHTKMTSPIPDAAKEKFARRRVPLRRFADPEEVAHITLSVALPAASFLNGAVIPVDGGLHAKFD